MSLNIVLTAGLVGAAASSRAHTTSTTTAAHVARTHKRNWPAATKSAFYANFYAVDEATGANIG
jgi:hypothetical protein